ncbi:hypothetical protein [Auraticoccus monumenti]|uniref:Uncharacterized protein n=1 Tax=Auraticoccus monumenti TaxID=675864 RepID=A0A1G6UQS1_9ACTN|nr:hypothetical protein [Auraticoccus monumenti]SDD42905.1 hypothetical protein SAMN04489747_0929 [Auraticoccus monumenti]
MDATPTTGMTTEAAEQLRRTFPPTSVGTLPKPMQKNAPKGQCRECGGYHGLPAVHLPYVGHAAVTDRLLSVDPGWSWEPMATDERGLPALDSARNLWIRLTVLGVTRIGVGDGVSAKEAIGDAIRNAAMRFGVALDLWSKEELESSLPPEQLRDAPPSEPDRPISDLDRARNSAWLATEGRGTDDERKTLLTDFLAQHDVTPETASPAQWTAAAEKFCRDDAR